MADQVLITFEQMEQRAKEYANEADKVNATIKAMDDLIPRLLDEWKGDSSVAFANRYRELRPGFVDAQELITEISSALRKVAQRLREVDSDIAGGFRS